MPCRLIRKTVAAGQGVQYMRTCLSIGSEQRVLSTLRRGVSTVMTSCFYCGSNGPFSKREHVDPESLGNDDMIPVGARRHARADLPSVPQGRVGANRNRAGGRYSSSAGGRAASCRPSLRRQNVGSDRPRCRMRAVGDLCRHRGHHSRAEGSQCGPRDCATSRMTTRAERCAPPSAGYS